MATVKFKIGGVIVERELDLENIEGQEIELSDDNLVIHSKEDFNTLESNIRKDEYDKTKVKAEEMAMKNIKNATGYEIEGYKDVQTFADNLKIKIQTELGTEPNEKIAKLESDKTALQNSITELQTNFDTFKNDVAQRESRTSKDNLLLSFIPDKGLKVDSDIALMALKNKAGLDVDLADGNRFATVNGKRLQNNLREDIQISQDIVVEKLTSLNLFEQPSGGNGGNDSSGGGKKNGYDAFVEEMKKDNINPGSEKFNIELQNRIANKTIEM